MEAVSRIEQFGIEPPSLLTQNGRSHCIPDKKRCLWCLILRRYLYLFGGIDFANTPGLLPEVSFLLLVGLMPG
jgi:hypothetical protein